MRLSDPQSELYFFDVVEDKDDAVEHEEGTNENHGCRAKVPLGHSIHCTIGREEEHHVLNADQVDLILILHPVVLYLFVRHDERDVQEVGSLETIKHIDEAHLIVLKQ